MVDAQEILPGAIFDRDPTIDYDTHKVVLNTMATCHSLRIVDDQLIGDPLDLKMFDFTRWSFEEGGKNANYNKESASYLSPSVARPPPGMKYEFEGEDGTGTVSCSSKM